MNEAGWYDKIGTRYTRLVGEMDNNAAVKKVRARTFAQGSEVVVELGRKWIR
jgi:hypothetical protein